MTLTTTDLRIKELVSRMAEIQVEKEELENSRRDLLEKIVANDLVIEKAEARLLEIKKALNEL